MEGEPTQQPRQPGAPNSQYPPTAGMFASSRAPGTNGRYPAADGWRAPDRRWAARNPLDPYIFSFQRRWETNRQFRATASAVIALTATILLCACVTLATTLATGAIARAGGPAGGAHTGSQNTGTNAFSNPTGYPTNTIPAWAPPVYPAVSPIPNSKTPAPSPSAAPSVSPSPTPTGGPVVTTCNGASQGIVWSLSPCPQRAGQTGTLTIQAPAYKNRGVNIILSFGCIGAGCTLDYQPTTTRLNVNGALSISYPVPAAAANSQVDISGFIQPTGGPQVSIDAAPVQ